MGEAATLGDGLALLAGVSWTTLAVIAAVSFVASTVGNTTGFGMMPIIMMAIAPVVGVKAVVPVMSVVGLVTNVARLHTYRDGIRWRPALICSLGAVPGVILGAMLYARMSAGVVALIIAGFMFVTVAARRMPKRGAGEVRRRHLPPAGVFGLSAVWGVINGIVTGAGVMIVVILLSSGLEGVVLLGTRAAAGMIMTVAKLGAYSGLDVLGWDLAMIGLLISACTVPGVWASRRLVDVMPVRVHTMVLEALIVIGGGYFLLRGLDELNVGSGFLA
ncbi:MAG: sulfite exporter TauE/SafE family protein [Acetobacterales bacterium]